MSKHKDEIEIIELLNYFKKGVKHFFKGIVDIFKWIFNLGLNFLLLLKNNIVLIGVSILTFLVLWYWITHSDSMKNYGYETIVETNYNSSEALYSLINSYSNNTNLFKNKESNIIQSISILPIENEKNIMDAYYNVLNDEFDTNRGYKSDNKRDTIYFRQINVEDFKKKLTPTDYKRHIIKIKSKSPLNEDKIYSFIKEPIENIPDLKLKRDTYVNALSELIIETRKNKNLVDSILIQINNKPNKSSSSTFSLESTTSPSNVEKDLLNESRRLMTSITNLKLKKVNLANVINIISPPKEVEPDRRIKRSPFIFSFIGFLFALGIILFIKIYKYLDKIEK